MTERKRVAVGYRRVSREEQVTKGTSLPGQSARITRYCKEQGVKLLQVLGDEALSGTKADRPGIMEALSILESGQAQVLVTTALDRLFRDVEQAFRARRLFIERGIELHVAGRGRVDLDSPEGLLLFGMDSLVAMHYAALISSKTRQALGELKQQGVHLGRVPIGKVRGEDGRLQDDMEAVNAIRRAKRRRAEGASWGQIAEEFGWTRERARYLVDSEHKTKVKAALKGAAKSKCMVASA